MEIEFYIADDLRGRDDRSTEVRLRLFFSNHVSADRFSVVLNGQSLAGETMHRVRKSEPDTFNHSAARNHWLDFHLRDILPQKGDNILRVDLESRPEGLHGSVQLEEIEIIIDYSPYPSGL